MDRSKKDIISNLSSHLFWDMDIDQVDLDKFPAQIIQRVLECGELNDWRIILGYYGLPYIVECCQSVRFLDPVVLAYICCISHTDKSSFRCCQPDQSIRTPWNS